MMKQTVLERERLNKGWTRAELARHASMQAGVIGWIETRRFIPYPSQLEKLADALGIEDSESLMNTAER